MIKSAPSISDYVWLKEEAKKIHAKNRQTGVADWCGHSYDFSCPSHLTYPFQWFWDSCFNAITLSHFDIQRAESEIKSLLKNQHDDGFISHVTFWQRDQHEEVVSNYAIAFRNKYLTDEMQPPLLAEAVAAVAARGRGAAFIREVLPAVRRFYDWLDSVRSPYGDGLVRVVQPDETGLDHSPKWDELMEIKDEENASWFRGWNLICNKYLPYNRDPKKMIAEDYFVVADVMVNVIYIENLRVLERIYLQLDDVESAEIFAKRAKLARESLDKKCWDESAGLYFDVNGKTDRKIEVNTFSSLMPLLLGDLDPKKRDRLMEHLLDPREYWAEYPIPTVAMNHPTFRPDTVGGNLVFRGPTWLHSNWYLGRALIRHGRQDLAAHIAKQSIELIRKSGVREYYNPSNGNGWGAPDFSWSTVLLDLVERVI
ncbi:MAG: amylo-alpha-1,6-glucosidase [Actinomycetota bacterium]